MRPNISLITLGVSDLERSIRFYRDGLGWPTTAKPDDGVAFFPLSGIVLGLFPRTELAKDAGVSDDGDGFTGFSLAHNTRSKEEVDEVMKTAKKAGAAIMKQPQDVFWGGYSGYFSDPDGHLWEVAFNPFWTLDEEGRVILGD